MKAKAESSQDPHGVDMMIAPGNDEGRNLLTNAIMAAGFSNRFY